MYNVLVADDEPIERVIVTKILKKHFGESLEIIQAVNGREAVKKAEENNCKIAFLDIEMPGMSGLEAAEEIRTNMEFCNIVFITAFDEFNYVRKALTIKALDYLLKPVSEEELITVAEEAVHLLEKEKEVRCEECRIIEDKSDIRMNVVTGRIRQYIESHYSEDISLQDIAGTLHYSDAYFCKIFKQNFDKNFLVYLAEFRVEKAKKLLDDLLLNVKEVGTLVGYPDSNYFTKVFKRHTGLTPTEYRGRNLDKG